MEHLLQYAWKHKFFPLEGLTTTDGRPLEVLNTGLQNTDSGPDFSGAVIKIDGVEWVGNVEMHLRTSDWFKHGHQTDPAYDNIILHVACEVDMELHYPNGSLVPQLQFAIPDEVKDNYVQLLNNEHSPRCANVISYIPKFTIHSWMSSLQVERLEMRTQQIMERREKLGKNWEDTFFVTVARNFGFGKNGDAFERWAQSIPMSAVGKHRDSLFQIEAIFFGQAGLLDDEVPMAKGPKSQSANADTAYYDKLRREYNYLKQKFSLQPIERKAWKFFRLRPQNFPHIRIAQLAMLYYEQKMNMSKVFEAKSVEDIERLFDTHVSDFWQTHYSFTSEESTVSEKHLSQSSIHLIIINSVAPLLFAYGRYKNDDPLCERAIELWENIKAESNRIIRDWTNAGIKPEHAADSQALIQLTRNYCDRRDCIRCRFGNEYIRRNPDFMFEDESQ